MELLNNCFCRPRCRWACRVPLTTGAAHGPGRQSRHHLLSVGGCAQRPRVQAAQPKGPRPSGTEGPRTGSTGGSARLVLKFIGKLLNVSASVSLGIKWAPQYSLPRRAVVRTEWNNPGQVLRAELAPRTQPLRAAGRGGRREMANSWEPGNLDSHPVSETLVMSSHFSELQFQIRRGKRSMLLQSKTKLSLVLRTQSRIL